MNVLPHITHPEHLIHPKYRADIDGLRAIAVLSVVGFHAFPFLVKGGFIGVDIFFVISGYLISTIIIGSLGRNSFSFIEFYSRRIRRIFPALLLVLISCFAFGWFVLLADEYKQLGKHIAGGAGFISNFLFWSESGYFDNTAETKPLLHLWSLGIEEQFYIIWPLLLWLAWKKRFNLLFITIIVAVISFWLNIASVRSNTVAAFYSPQTRFWELLGGSVLAYMTLHKQNIFPKLKHKIDVLLCQMAYAQLPEANGKILCNVQSVFGAILIAIGVFVITKEMHFPGWWAVLPTLGAALIISAGAQAWFNRMILSNRVLVWFGLISFPLYLWHWPLLSFVRIMESGTPSHEIRIAVVLIAIIFSWLTFRLIEKPIRFGKYSNAKTFILIFLMAGIGSVGYVAYKKSVGLAGYRNFNISENVSSQFSWSYINNDVCLNRYPYEHDPSAHWYCMTNKDEKPTLLLVGNSFANHLYPGLANNASFKHHTILSFGICDAAAPAEPDEPDFEKNPLQVCATKGKLREQKYLEDIIDKSGSVKFAIIDGLDRSPSKKYISRVKKRIDMLEKHQIKVIVFTPHFIHFLDIRSCFARAFRKQVNCDFDINERTQLTDKFNPLIRQLSITNPNVIFFDPNDLFCNKEKCSEIRNGMPLSRDLDANGHGGHLSEYGSIELSNIFEKWARTNFPQILNN